ncbi:hypothetical protein Lesp02_30740 [Lentzea sp. NBRC 105346]|nr:hypothetical protein Lesp02_30740 [Lentzea sp. NBRC 105346]
METTPTGEIVRGWPGYEDWVFEVDVDLRRNRVHLRSPNRPKRSRRRLADGEARRIMRAVGASWGLGVFDPTAAEAAEQQKRLVRERLPAATGFDAVDFVVASRPYPRGRHNKRERAETVAMVYGIALSQGLCPYKVLSRVYGHRVDTTGDIDKFSTTVTRWVREARQEGFLAPFDRARDMPQRWPGSPGHELEGRRSPVMKPTPWHCTCGNHDER